jgi:hypothetical protein
MFIKIPHREVLEKTIFTLWNKHFSGTMKELYKNVVDLKEKHRTFKNPNFRYSVSGRWVGRQMNILRYLQFYYVYLDVSQVATVFGSTTEPSSLYGGRTYDQTRSLNPPQIKALYDHDIGLALTLTNHYFSNEIYTENLPFLEKYHRKGNVIICTSDDLARSLRRDFPLFNLRASIIKNLNTVQKVSRALDLYDDVVIPMEMNDDDDFLESLPQKGRIMLFANSACAYGCPARICYAEISKFNQSKTNNLRCKKEELGMLEYAFYFFNVEKFNQMGFSNFKLVPAKLFNNFLKSKP